MDLCIETAADRWEVEALYDLCFAPGREALSSYRLRAGVDPVAPLCLLLRDDGIVAAAIRYWPVRIGAPGTCAVSGRGAGPASGTQTRACSGGRALLLGPVAVHPTRQGEGLGAWLIQTSLERAGALGWERVLLVGDAPYYGRFGFVRLDGVRMPPPTDPGRVLGLELRPGSWRGVRGDVMRAAPG